MTNISIELTRRKELVKCVSNSSNIFRVIFQKEIDKYFLTHFIFYQLTLPFKNDPFIRDLTNEEGKDILKSLIKLYSKSKDNKKISDCQEKIYFFFKEAKQNIDKTDLSNENNFTVEIKNGEVILYNLKKIIFRYKIASKYLKKLNKQRGEKSPEKIFLMIYRYETLNLIAKETMQLSASDEYYLYIQKKFNVSIECFASPINSHLTKYFSAFPDVDKPFGSLGSFFDNGKKYLENKNISGSCDTPYQINAIENNVKIIFDVLKKNNGKFKNTFIFVLPAWRDANYYNELKNSIYSKAFIEIPKEIHNYELHKIDKIKNKIVKPCDTIISILSNTQIIVEEKDKLELIMRF